MLEIKETHKYLQFQMHATRAAKSWRENSCRKKITTFAVLLAISSFIKIFATNYSKSLIQSLYNIYQIMTGSWWNISFVRYTSLSYASNLLHDNRIHRESIDPLLLHLPPVNIRIVILWNPPVGIRSSRVNHSPVKYYIYNIFNEKYPIKISK